MAEVWVQLSDDRTIVTGEFSGPQGGNPNAFAVDEDDARLLAFRDADGIVTRKAAVDALRDGKLRGGYADATTGRTFQTRPGTDDLTKLTARGAGALAAIVLGAPNMAIRLIPADNATDFSLPATDALALINSRIGAWVESLMFRARELKNEIDAGGDPDIEAGWPS